MENVKIGFIGFGKMGSALADGICNLNTSIIKKENILYHSLSASNKNYECLSSNTEVVYKCNIIVCAVKPDKALSVLKDIKDILNNKIIISICAGISIDEIENIIGNDKKIVRMMPNITCLVGKGVLLLTTNNCINKNDLNIVVNIFKQCGLIYETKENFFNILTVLTSSSPAFFFYFVESLIDAAVKNGLSRDVSINLILKTIEGCVNMILKCPNISLQEFKDNVSSPGGITVEGLYVLEKHRFKYSIINAIDAAYEKSKNITKK